MSLVSDPTVMRRLNGYLTIFWIIMIPVSFATGWVSSVKYVSAISLWALVASHWATWQSARVEETQEREAEEREADPVEEKVVAAMVKETDTTAA